MSQPIVPRPRPFGTIVFSPSAILVLVLLAHSGSLKAPFVFDDTAAIVHNPTIRVLGSSAIFSPPADGGTTTCSSEELAAAAGVNSAKLRKDLSYLGSYGTRGVGYDVEYLRYQIAREIGVTQDWPVVIVGAGNLGQADFRFSADSLPFWSRITS